MSKTGACLCGAVSFAFSGEPRFVGDCVCEFCRRAHGASVVGWLGVKTEQFLLPDGDEALAWYASSETSERGFCVRCGTRVLFRSTKWPGEVHMALACLDTPDAYRSSGISFGDEFPAWTSVRPPEQTKT